MLLIATLHLEGERQPLLGEFHTGSVGFSQACITTTHSGSLTVANG